MTNENDEFYTANKKIHDFFGKSFSINYLISTKENHYFQVLKVYDFKTAKQITVRFNRITNDFDVDSVCNFDL